LKGPLTWGRSWNPFGGALEKAGVTLDLEAKEVVALPPPK